MIRLTHTVLNEPLEVVDNIVNVLVIESPRCLREFAYEFDNLSQNLSSNISLSKNYEDIVFSKNADVIYNLHDVELSSKKIQTKIYATLKELAYSEDFYTETSDVTGKIMSYLQNLIFSSDIPLVFDDVEVEGLFKAVSLKVDTQTQTLLEKIISYIEIYSRYFKTHIFVFFHLKDYLEEEELQELYKFYNYNKENLILIESNAKEEIEYEKITIIDKDLCQII